MNSPFTRRRFIQLGSTLLAANTFTPNVFSQAPAKKRAFKKGYMLNAFPSTAKGMSLLEKFKLLKAAGFDGVEPNSHTDRKEIQQAREATGLELASISCGDHTRMFSDQAPARRKQGVDGLLYAIETAHEFGAKSVLVVAGGVNEKVSYVDNYQRTQEAIRQAIPRAEKLGVALAIENVWNNFLLSPLEAARFVDEFNSPAVGWHFDVGNVMSIGWPEQWIRILGKRIRNVHIKEYSRKKQGERGPRAGFSMEYLEGDNNWPGVMKALDEIGYNGWAILEPACNECKQKTEAEAYLKKVSEQFDKILAT